MLGWFRSSRRIMRCGIPKGIPSAESTRTAKVINPKPPIWIKSAMTACPKPVKAVPVSTTASPVTVTAEVEVNSASDRLIPAVFASGVHRINPPRTTIVR